MNRETRVRRIALLCCGCLRNIASFKAGWRRPRQLKVAHPFWVNLNSNSLDIAVLEWCKLFGKEKHEKHHWKRAILDHAEFLTAMCAELRMTPVEFEKFTEKVLRYRDKFIAHLDDDLVMNIPRIRVMRKSAAFYYKRILNDPKNVKSLFDAPSNPGMYYGERFKEALAEYRQRAAN